MISLIVCSRAKDIPARLRANVAQTIGCEYEWVVVDNSSNRYSIFQAYNEGVRRASGEVLCFMHDDVIFHSSEWGQLVASSFAEQDTLGAVGVVGSMFIPKLPAPMWAFQKASVFRLYSPLKPDLSAMEFTDAGTCEDQEGYWFANLRYANGSGLTPVANIDGLWMCIRASLFDRIRFDDTTFGGFHCYDADIAMQINTLGYDLAVSTDILIEHLSPGKLTQAYFDACERWYAKWQQHLPVVRGIELTPRQQLALTLYTHDALMRQKELLRYEHLLNSHAYRLGASLLRPYRKVRDSLSNLTKNKPHR